MGILIPVSRGISREKDIHRAADAFRQAIQREVSESRGKTAYSVLPRRDELRRIRLANRLVETGCVQFGRFTLKSGLESPFYIDLRRLFSHPSLLSEAASAYLPLLEPISFDRIAGIPYAALPIATAISLQAGWPMVYPRKEVKPYGTKETVEGEYKPGDKVVLIDDLATTGGSKFEAIEKMAAAGLQVSDVVVLIDRQSGAAEALTAAGYRLHAVYSITQLLDIWKSSGLVSADQEHDIVDFLKSTSGEG
jgi:uridine monophosphate synthetase